MAFLATVIDCGAAKATKHALDRITMKPLRRPSVPRALMGTSVRGSLTKTERQQYDSNQLKGKNRGLVQASASTDIRSSKQKNEAMSLQQEFDEGGQGSALLDEILKDIRTLRKEGGAMRRPSISSVFYTVLSSVLVSVVAPFSFSPQIAEVLIPTAASVIAVTTAAAEFQGKDATADAKEIAAVALAQAARAEAYLSRAEKAKAIMPAMVGASATAATLCLIFPALMASGVTVNPVFVAVCPIVSTTAAAWGATAGVETLAQGLLALGKMKGNRVISVREAKTPALRNLVLKQRLNSIARALVPPFLIGLFMPGDFVFRSIVASAVAAASVAYNLAEAETVVAEVALKVAYISKSAAQADVFANQAAAESSVLPFTSAVAGVSTALAAALVEVQPLAAALMPTFGAVASGVAAAASARCEMDATSTRLAFRDSGLQKIAPAASVPGLFQTVMPQLLESMLRSAVDIISDSIKDIVSDKSMEPTKIDDSQVTVVGESMSSEEVVIVDGITPSKGDASGELTRIRKRDRMRRWLKRGLRISLVDD